MSVIVQLDWAELAMCGDIGVRRQVSAFAKNRQHYGNPDGTEPVFDQHIGGVISEFAVARFFNLFWQPSIGKIDSVDVGNLIEARVRMLPGNGSDLAIRPTDHDYKPYVHVHVHRERPWEPELIGWLYGREGKHPDVPLEPKRQVWFNPPPYRELAELVEWVAQHRQQP
jgi:hypothetical protein